MTHIVFGGSNGIGREIVSQFIKNEDNDIIIVDASASFHSLDRSYIGDISSVEFRDYLVSEIKKVPRIRSITWSIRYRQHKEQDNINILNSALDVEIISFSSIINSLDEKIASDSPSVVLVSSIASSLISSQHFSYNIVKSAGIAAVRAFAVKYGEVSRARFNCVSPGIVSFNAVDLGALNSKDHLDTLRKSAIPRLLPVTASEIAKLCQFLVSPDSSALNGANIIADGGESLLDQYYVAQRTQHNLKDE